MTVPSGSSTHWGFLFLLNCIHFSNFRLDSSLYNYSEISFCNKSIFSLVEIVSININSLWENLITTSPDIGRTALEKVITKKIFFGDNFYLKNGNIII